MTAEELAHIVGGRVDGDGSAALTGLAALEDAEPGDLTFLANPRYAAQVSATRASAVLVAEDWDGSCACALIRVASPDAAFAMAAARLGPEPVRFPSGVHPSAVLADGVELGNDVSVGPYCVLEEGTKVGDHSVLVACCYLGHGTFVGSECKLYPHVTTREHTRIGHRVVIHSGTIIGSDGFGFVPLEDGRWGKVPQNGIVVIGDDVEIGANVTIDRARFGRTVIGDGVKIDNLVQVAHNVKIGANSAIAAQVGISGSAALGSGVRIGGQAGVVGHVRVGDGCTVAGRAGVTKSVPAGTFVSGFPATPHAKARKLHAHMVRLPELKARVNDLGKRLSELEKSAGEKG